MSLNSDLTRNQISKYIHPASVVKSEHKDGYACHRGISIYVRTLNKSELKCMCPPSTYGYYCLYQSQRVSLTVKVRSATDWLSVFTFVFLLITDQNEIESYDYRYYSSITDCILKWNIYLLYRTRPKDASKNYSIRIYVYKRQATALEYRTSWHYPLYFSFLPVQRMAIQITIPSLTTIIRESICSLACNKHGSCIVANINTTKKLFLCRCDPGWYGFYCQYAQNSSLTCSCAPNSLCISNYPISICICSLGRGGPKCWIKIDDCQGLNRCQNGGQCTVYDERQRWYAPICVCPDDYRGPLCEFPLQKFLITFHYTIQIPSLVFLHFISYDTYLYKRITSFKKINPYETSATIRTTISNMYLPILFIEYEDKYYVFPFVKDKDKETNIHVHSENRCLSINDLFNSSLVQLHRIRRIKYYHWFCQKHLDLMCFYDKIDVCLCNDKREAVCIRFDQNTEYICQDDSGNCENGGECFQDDIQCPSRAICRCPTCFHGSKCQFSTKSFSLSLDNILGYQIRPNSNLRNQLSVVKFSLVFVVIMWFIGILNGIISIMTFIQNKSCEVGSGFYLLSNSLISILIIILFASKFIILILTQTSHINHKMFLLVQCISIDFLLRTCVNFGDWLNACVAVERALTVIQGIYFNKERSKRIAKWTIVSLFLITASTNLHDPLNRHLIIDEDEQRIWCIVRYSSFSEAYNSISQILHFALPFVLNIISSLFIIIGISRRRSRTQKDQTFKNSISKQLILHKHLLISPITLILLATPRLIISLVSGCMKIDRNPWLPLIGYFISFIPSLLIFVVFVLPSKAYKTECKNILKSIYHRIRQRAYI
ncbi:hypothetical protein I4U23_016388 [Adineta vaga]|nr:hypothetical protein I4U23_016388 [Adineta vaga]